LKVQGYIAKETVKKLLANYQGLIAGDLAVDAMPCNSGPKAYDGVTGMLLNKIMLDEAVESLPPKLRACVTLRWLRGKSRGETLMELAIGQKEYYKSCDLAVDAIYRKINGRATNYQNLLNKIAAK